MKSFLMHWVPSVAWLTFVWCALWQDFKLPNLAMGILLSLLALAVFKLPTLYLSNRFNLWYALKFLVYLVWKIAQASVQLLWVAITFKHPLNNSIIAVQLRTSSDLWITAISHSMSVIPGSVVVEVDRTISVLYFHVINTETEEEINDFIKQVRTVETMILKAVGSREEYERILDDEREEVAL